MSTKCSSCSRDTKYRCIFCRESVCNVCSEVVSEDFEGYEEDQYLIGRCKDGLCTSKRKLTKDIERQNVETPAEKKTKQAKIAAFFGFKAAPSKSTFSSSAKPSNSTSSSAKVSTSSSGPELKP